MGAKMAEGTLVREHILKMIGFLNELETLGATINTHTQVDIIPNSLHASFAQFKLNINMNQMNFSMSELMSSLQSAEGIIKPWTNVLNVEVVSASTSTSMPIDTQFLLTCKEVDRQYISSPTDVKSS